MNRIQLIFTFIVISIAFNFTFAQKSDGHLLIIGGGNRPDYLTNRIIELAGGVDSRIVIIPMASGDPLGAALYQKEQFERLGVKDVDYIICNKEEANLESNLKKLDNTTSIYFSGGDQSLLTDAILDTKLIDKIHGIYKNGGVISGTSAGAAVMSKIMITGNELINKDSTYSFFAIQEGNIETVEGFGFVTEAIIDQHFIMRKRLNRLISVVLENPNLVGVGIDESTSIIVNPDRTFEVLGERTIMIFDATESNNIQVNSLGLMSASDMKMHILSSGQKYDLINKKVIE